MNKKIAVLGATGSVGTQALDVARSRGYTVDLLTADSNVALMETLCREFSPKVAVMANNAAGSDLAVRLSDTTVKVLCGTSAIPEAISASCADVVVNSILGEAGLMPTLATIDCGKRLALANKESLVIAGDIVMSRLTEKGGELIPVDSEHCAIFQSLKAGRPAEVKRIILTASGGPFYGYSCEELETVTLADTLAHPTWKMGKKITVDSATLMNKGFEVIEAVHLFGVSAERVDVTVHRESILHSAVEYIDNSIIGEFSVPDMRMCVQYAVDYPDRRVSSGESLDLFSVGKLTFAKPDTDAFPLLALAKRAIDAGGGMPAVLNASDEIAVAAFLGEKIRFTDIARVVEATYERMYDARHALDLDSIIAADRMARGISEEIITAIAKGRN